MKDVTMELFLLYSQEENLQAIKKKGSEAKINGWRRDIRTLLNYIITRSSRWLLDSFALYPGYYKFNI